MSLRLSLRLPTCSCLPTLGAGAVVLVSVLSPSKFMDMHATTLPTPWLTQRQSVVLLVVWLVVLASGDCAATCWRRLRAAVAHKERAARVRLQAQKQAVLAELQSTGLLSHMMRNPASRVLPFVLRRGTSTSSQSVPQEQSSW